MEGFKNLIEVSAYFADQDRATEYLISKRWPTGVRCAHCNHAKVYTLKGANKRFKCAQCRKQFSAIKGTIFENSPLPLQKWFTAIYLITSHKKGISSYQLGRDLSISQAAAWFVLHRVRHSLRSGIFVHAKDAIIEIDETFIGGATANKHECKIQRMENKHGKGHAISTKTPVLGILERGGMVSAKVVPNVFKTTLLPEIYDVVKDGTKVMTDDNAAYKDLKLTYDHETVNHSL